jgi:hypothetical protein
MLTVLFNSTECVRVNLLPQGTSFTAAYFVDTEIIPMANSHTQQRGDIARPKVHLQFGNSKCQTARHVQEEMAVRQCVGVRHPLYSPDLAIADFHLFGG